MFSPGALLFAAAAKAGVSGMTIDTVTQESITLPASCTPASDRDIDVTYTASNIAGGTVTIERYINGKFDKLIHTGTLQASETVTDQLPWTRKTSTSDPTKNLQYRVVATEGGVERSARFSTGETYVPSSSRVCPT